MEMTQIALAELTGLTVRRIQMINAEQPDDRKMLIKGENGKYDAAIFVQRWVKYCMDREKTKNGELDLDQVKAQHEMVKMEKSELNLQVLKGQLVNTEEVRQLWGDIVTMTRNRLMHIPTSVAQRLVMLDDPAEIKAIIDKEIRDCLALIATCKLPQATDEQAADGEETDADE